MSHLFAEAQPPRDNWRVEIVEQRAESGLVLFEYAVREVNKDPFLLNNHKAQIRTNHQRVVVGPNGGMMHVSGVEVLDVEEFEKDARFHRWLDKDRNGNWRDDQGRTLAPFVFAAAPWAGEHNEELDPQWQREAFTLTEASQVQECIDRYQKRAEEKGYVGDKRGTTLNLQVGASGDDGYGTTGGIFQGAQNNMYAGKFSSIGYSSFVRFTGVSGLSGVTINTATYQAYGAASSAGSPLTKLQADDQASPSAPTNITQFNAISKTAAGVDWDGALSSGSFNTAPDIASVIQELATDYDPTVIQIMHSNDGTSDGSNNQNMYTYNHNSTEAAKLDIDYTAGGGGPVIPVFMNQYRQRWN